MQTLLIAIGENPSQRSIGPYNYGSYQECRLINYPLLIRAYYAIESGPIQAKSLWQPMISQMEPFQSNGTIGVGLSKAFVSGDDRFSKS
jgi:hypothetical protein